VYDGSKLLPKSQFQQLLKLLPTPRQNKRGRRHSKKEALLLGILQVLVNGCSWKKIADCGCSYASCFRYLQELQRRGTLKLILQRLVQEQVDITVGSIDTTLVISFAFADMTAWNGQHKQIGTKVSLFVGKDGLPADVQFGNGNKNDKDFVLDHLKNVAGKRKRVINLDMSYMSLALRRAMRQKGIRINMKTRAQDFRRKRGRKFKLDNEIYNLRMEVERTNSWVKAFRALRLRRSPHPAMFKAFVYLALIIVLLRYSRFCNR
jgi:transposase